MKLCERCQLVPLPDARFKYCEPCKKAVRAETFRQSSKRYRDKHADANKRRRHMSTVAE